MPNVSVETTRLRAQARRVVSLFGKHYPSASCSLTYREHWQLLFAILFSAQNLDATVNTVTEPLFSKFPSLESFANAKRSEIEKHTKRLNYWKTKTEHALQTARILIETYKGEIPSTIETLRTLPGIGRKSANAYLGEALGIADGIVVDTHVKRISYRLGLTRNTDPEKVEKNLLLLIPKSKRIFHSHACIDHGRAICMSRNPKCDECPFKKICPSAGIA